MQVNATASRQANPTGSAGRQSIALGQEAFMELLLAQLRNQDPLKPIDSTQYVSQLAMLSNLEQTVQHNEKLDGLLTASQLSQAAAIVGRTITSADGTISGTVVGARVTSEGVVAELAAGQTLLVANGVTVGTK